MRIVKIMAHLTGMLAFVPPGLIAYWFGGWEGVFQYVCWLLAITIMFLALNLASRMLQACEQACEWENDFQQVVFEERQQDLLWPWSRQEEE